jgi:hypothetical protein
MLGKFNLMHFTLTVTEDAGGFALRIQNFDNWEEETRWFEDLPALLKGFSMEIALIAEHLRDSGELDSDFPIHPLLEGNLNIVRG